MVMRESVAAAGDRGLYFPLMRARSDNPYKVIVIGGGHAGAEAAWAAANLTVPRGGRVALVTMDPAKIGTMSCNPAIGGLAKGQMVREIDALGGLMGLAIDATGIQFRVLNASKGPAVRGPRAQADKYRYAQEVQRLLRTRENLDIIAGSVEELLVDNQRCVGVAVRGTDRDESLTLRSAATVLTTGTFMRGLMHTGPQQTEGGRVGEAPAVGISGALRELGFELGRLKTGTPPRLAAETIDFESLERQPGDETPCPFSEMTGTPTPRDGHPSAFPVLEQVCCWITHTNAAAHDAIRANLDRAPMYNGQIETAGPRYCPSIEDKVVRFADRSSHHVFLEPESLSTNEIYCNGISTSLPADVQDLIVRNLPGCEQAEILRHGYAVEYDMVWPHQIDATCMTKRVPGLFLAGQINGTSGYEEAAGQGLIAGLNAVRFGRGEDLVRLTRDEAYIGVLLDDLVTKTPREPYRMFTSRAEHRLLLRSDNAPSRLTPMGRELGLVDDERWGVFQIREDARKVLGEWLRETGLEKWTKQPDVDADAVRDILLPLPSRERAGVRVGLTSKLDASSALNAHTLTPALSLKEGEGAGHVIADLPSVCYDRRVIDPLLADAQYAGYIERHRREIARLAEREHTPLPIDHDYTTVKGLRNEAALTLNRFQPATLGQAARLAGVTPADLMVVSVTMGR